MDIGIVGYGHVGRAMKELFPDAAVYDPFQDIGSRAAVNRCNITFVCVPTPSAPDSSCDTSAVEEVAGWLETPLIVLRSTVPVGFTDSLRSRLGKRIVFQPEYYGETPGHPFADLRQRTWITLGGEDTDCQLVAELYRSRYDHPVDYYFVTATEAELAKYMTNAFLASKVVFCNAMYDLAQSCGADYDAVRTAWLADPRIGNSHTQVYPQNRGYGGSCFPKDVEALRFSMASSGIPTDFLDGVIRHNQYFRSLHKE